MKPEDLEISIYDPTPRGGMRVCLESSAVTVFHKPTKLGITIGTERSQHANKEKAMQMLSAMVYPAEWMFHNMQGHVEAEITPHNHVPGKVAMIKEVRDRTGTTLREAKDAVDQFMDVELAVLHIMNMPTAGCTNASGCVCGGDVPAVREGCYYWSNA